MKMKSTKILINQRVHLSRLRKKTIMKMIINMKRMMTRIMNFDFLLILKPLNY